MWICMGRGDERYNGALTHRKSCASVLDLIGGEPDNA